MELNKELDVAENLSPLLVIHHDGRVERFKGTETVPPSVDASTGVSSKDVIIDPSKNISVRIYLPPFLSSNEKLPLVVYFHGGAFLVESAASPQYHNYLNSLSSRARALCVSVDYRLAPEHPLPAAYDDSFAALTWVISKSDPWISDHGNLDKTFLAGDSAGANIAHNIAIRIGENIEGVIAVHPYFWFRDAREENSWLNEWNERLWRVVYPDSLQGLKEPCVNPPSEILKKMRCRRVLVCIAEEDFLREQGEYYLETLKESGYPGCVDAFVSAGVGHIFHLFQPEGESAEEIMRRLVEFLNPGPDLDPGR